MNNTLQELCAVGAAITICNDPNVKEIMFATSKHLLEFSSDNDIEKFKSWQSTFLEEISHLKNFPIGLLGNVKYVVLLVSIEMLKWARFHKDTFSLSFEFSKKFISTSMFTTTTGTIDREKAAKALMEEKSLKPSILFRIGSYYGLSEKALKYWTQVPNFEISSLRSGNTVVSVWADFLLGYNKGINFSYDVLKAAVDSGSEASFCYYWEKLDEGTKEEAVNYFAQTFFQKLKLLRKNRKCVDFIYICEPYIEMFKFLIQNFAFEKLKTLLNKHKLTYWVLTYLLHWPYQSLLLDTVKLVWDILSKEEFDFLLIDIIAKIDDPFVGKLYDYRVLFGKIWKESPTDFKMFLFTTKVFNTVDYIDFDFHFEKDIYDTRRTFGYHVLIKLFNLKFTDVDEQNVRSILRSFEVWELRRILHAFGKEICISAIRNGNFRCVDLFIECCKVEDLNEFKKNLVNTTEFQTILDDLLEEFKLDSIDQILKWALDNYQLKIFKQRLSALISVHLHSKTDSYIILECEGSSELDLIFSLESGIIINVFHFLKNFIKWIILERFNKINEFLKWIFPTVQEIDNYKRELVKGYCENNDKDTHFRKNIILFCTNHQP